MKRIQKKVKDLVDVRSHKSLQDFVSHPAETLSTYHFTDFTSDLMAKFLDKVTAVQKGNGAASALAGYRGVGKSHFLATFGAIALHPEMRSKITDLHVSASIQRLKRVSYPVAYVRRGTSQTLIDEIKDAIAKCFKIDGAYLNSSLPDLLHFAAERAMDAPLIIIVDTAFERTSRVAREDGAILGEIAELAKKLNVFVAVALDDDITGADGINAAIAQSFTIDYLDQEHLYRIVDKHIFQKQFQTQLLLHEIYTNFREVLPHFRWSEQRFASLYPLHPVILEIAPFVRLYSPEFALLGFASEAGGKILGRPANSLIALDEVFDSIENSFRKVDELKDAFAIYDKLNTGIIAQIPVLQRLQAKLVLKGLFLLSLKGEGATAGEIAAAMLIYDENEPQKAIRTVEELLDTFAKAFPTDIKRVSEENREVRYGLQISNKDNLNDALAEAAQTISPDVIPKFLRSVGRSKFSDWTFSDENQLEDSNEIECQIAWRGSVRRGRVIWNLENKFSDKAHSVAGSEFLDWEIFIVSASDAVKSDVEKSEIPKVFWKTAALKKDEIETILRYYVLLTDTNLRDEYGEQIRAVGQAHLIRIEKIWNRVFLNEAKIFIDGFDYSFTEEASNADTLTEILSKILEPLFDSRFPNHPFFTQTLTATEVSVLVNDYFSSARQNLAETQKLAEIFAFPLGLVNLRENGYVIESEENLVNLPLAQEILKLVKDNPEETVSLKTIYENFKQSAYGLAPEAQNLILTALVAQRQIEFVTSNGNRINRRSLDLKIIWNDIEGIAKPATVIYSNERLVYWLKILTESETIASIETTDDQKLVFDSLRNWLNNWQDSKILERFAELPDEILNMKIWRLAGHSEKTFGSVAVTVKAILDKTISLEEGLHRIVEAFFDSENQFMEQRKNLSVLENFIDGALSREKIWSYLAVCETTPDEEIEMLREQLFQIINDGYTAPAETSNREMEDLWQTFQPLFSEYFLVKHDLIMNSPNRREKFEEIMQSDDWWEFENLSRLDVLQQNYWKQTQKIVCRIKEFDCRFNTAEMLKTHPFCACSFSLAKIEEWENLPQKLKETVREGLINLRKELKTLSPNLIQLIEHFSAKNKNNEFLQAAQRLKSALEDNRELSPFSVIELSILEKITESANFSPEKLQIGEEISRAEKLSQNSKASVNSLPNDSFMLEV